jgi:hypothetical protein
VWASDTDKIPSGDIFLDLFSLNYPNYVHPHFEMTSKKIIEETGFYDESIPIWVDWDFRLRLASKYKSGYCNYIGNAYTTHTGGLTSTLKKETYLASQVKVIEKNKQHLSKYPPRQAKRAMKVISMHVKRMRLAINFQNHQPSFVNTVKYLAEYPQQIADWRFVFNSMFGVNFMQSLALVKQKLLGKR